VVAAAPDGDGAGRPDPSGLTVTVLGCSGSYAGPGSPPSSYLVRSASTTVLMDAGPGSLVNLQRHVALADLDAVVISHSHHDHWLDLMGLRIAFRYFFELPGPRVVTTAEVAERADTLAGDEGTGFIWDIARDGATRTVGDLAFRFSQTDHPVETLAMRIDHDGRSLAYSADTGPGWGIGALGPEIDVALIEASLEVEHEGGFPHLSGRQAGAMARQAGVGRLVVTHIPPTADPHRHLFDAEAAFGQPAVLAAIDQEIHV
jgi:ribonuclease BN (tRNA processing enzyme)